MRELSQTFPRSPSELTLFEDPDARVMRRSGGMAGTPGASAGTGAVSDGAVAGEAPPDAPLWLTGGAWAGRVGNTDAPDHLEEGRYSDLRRAGEAEAGCSPGPRSSPYVLQRPHGHQSERNAERE